jgi:hypothetical protein
VTLQLGRTVARTLAAGCAVVLTAACGKGGEKAKSETTAAAPPPAAAAAPSPPPGTLTKPIDQYTGDEFYALTQGLQYGGGGTHGRRCRGRAGCRGPNAKDSTRIQVEGIVGDDSLSATTLGVNGVLAMRLHNVGSYADSMYNTRPGAQYENYLIVLPVPNSASATWRLEELTTTPGSRSHRMISSGKLRECPKHAFQRGPHADFKTCEQADNLRPASFSRNALPLQGDLGPPAWFGCAFGCCTADPPDGHG